MNSSIQTEFMSWSKTLNLLKYFLDIRILMTVFRCTVHKFIVIYCKFYGTYFHYNQIFLVQKCFNILHELSKKLQNIL